MARIASLYLPWLGVVIENIGRLDYRKRIVNQIKRPVHLSSPRYFDYHIYICIYIMYNYILE